jgi:hypothetical protein
MCKVIGSRTPNLEWGRRGGLGEFPHLLCNFSHYVTSDFWEGLNRVTAKRPSAIELKYAEVIFSVICPLTVKSLLMNNATWL